MNLSRGKKKELIIGTILLVSLILIAGCISESQPETEAKYSLEAKMPQVNDSYMMYRVEPIEVTEDQVRNIAGRFGLSGTPKLFSKDTGERLLIDTSKQPEEQISVYTHSGSVVYHILDKELPTEVTKQPDLPTDTEAEKIALEFIEKIRMDSSDAKAIKIGVNQKQEVCEAGSSEPKVSYDVTKAVRFGRSLDGLPVYGDEFSVIIGDGGEVVGLVKTWRETVPYRKVSIKTPEQAYTDLLESKTIRPSVAAEYDSIVIENISLGYWMEPRGTVQETVWPVYVFSGTATYDNINEDYLAYVFAVDKRD